MRWREPDETLDHFPEGTCACGLDLAGAADLGVARSYQQEDVPEPRKALRYQHDLHRARCACGREHVAERPGGVPDATLSIGPRLSAVAVYLSVFQHVPVERARQLISDLTGGAVSAGWVHSCLARAAGLVKDSVALIRTLIAASPVAGFDETPPAIPGRPLRRTPRRRQPAPPQRHSRSPAGAADDQQLPRRPP
ncbi:MAG: transposase [Streptosporangiales bacterium]